MKTQLYFIRAFVAFFFFFARSHARFFLHSKPRLSDARSIA